MLAGFMEVAEAIGIDDGIATAKRNIVMAKSRLEVKWYIRSWSKNPMKYMNYVLLGQVKGTNKQFVRVISKLYGF
jgi:hypothetical protein